AIQALQGENPDLVTLLTPQVFDSSDQDALTGLYDPAQQVGWSTYVEIDPYTTYEAAQVSACAGPGE
ncbi:MAG TPA: LacI family transcriptional regulator, partial [Acidimicrobiia bacterium]|nr:LacI family transcriptional regulator [Acidimicrobiia bacterium]